MSTTYWIVFMIAGFFIFWALFYIMDKLKRRKKERGNVEENMWLDDQDKFG